jgi:hypothetical protein
VNHADSDHISASHDLLTGNAYPRVSNFITARRSDHPHIGAVLAKLKPQARDLPPYVQLPCLLKSNSGKVITGQYGGFLGKRYDPFIIDAVPNKEPTEDPEFTQFAPKSMQLEEGLTSVRLDGVRALVKSRHFHFSVLSGSGTHLICQRKMLSCVIVTGGIHLGRKSYLRVVWLRSVSHLSRCTGVTDHQGRILAGTITSTIFRT